MHGHWKKKIGVFYYEGWVESENVERCGRESGGSEPCTKTDWIAACATSGIAEGESSKTFVVNGKKYTGLSGGDTQSADININ